MKNRRKMRALAVAALLALVFTVPAAVIARGDQEAAEQTAEDADERLEEFEPTEEVDADEAISFPVDI